MSSHATNPASKGLEPISFDPIDQAEVALLRGQSWSDRLRIAGQLFFAARNMIAVSVRAKHPHWDETAVSRETARRLLNDNFAD